jgi:hypothetical protein
MSIPILKSGINAFYDSMRDGLVPVKVLEVKAPAKAPLFDLRSGLAPVSVKVKAQVTKDQGSYPKGHVIDTNAVHVVPKAAVKKGRYSSTIRLYKVETDPATKANPRKTWKKATYMVIDGQHAWSGKGWTVKSERIHVFRSRKAAETVTVKHGGKVARVEY